LSVLRFWESAINAFTLGIGSPGKTKENRRKTLEAPSPSTLFLRPPKSPCGYCGFVCVESVLDCIFIKMQPKLQHMKAQTQDERAEEKLKCNNSSWEKIPPHPMPLFPSPTNLLPLRFSCAMHFRKQLLSAGVCYCVGSTLNARWKAMR